MSYFSALSGNRFTFSRGSMLTVRDPETTAFDGRGGVTANDYEDGAVVHAKRARLLAADVPEGLGVTSLPEPLELVGPNSESLILEYRSAGANPYDNAVRASGVIAWYRQLDRTVSPPRSRRCGSIPPTRAGRCSPSAR